MRPHLIGGSRQCNGFDEIAVPPQGAEFSGAYGTIEPQFGFTGTSYDTAGRFRGVVCVALSARFLGSWGKVSDLANDKDSRTAPKRAPAKVQSKDRDMGSALRSAYQKTIEEQVPDEMLDLLNKLA